MKIKIDKKITVYGEKQPKDKLPENIEIEYKPSPFIPSDGYDLRDGEIEDNDFRKRKINPGEGFLSIVVGVGDEQIGDVYVNLQFESHKGESQFCVDQHNKLLGNANDWLRGILKEIAPDDAEFEVEMIGVPCPHHPMDIKNAVQNLNSEQETKVINGPIIGPIIIEERKREIS